MTTNTKAAVSIEQLERFCLDVLRRCGVGDEHAKQTADVLTTTDACGVFTHGTKALRGYAKRLRNGGLKPDAQPAVCAEGPAWAIVDGNSALGMVTSIFAMNTAIRKAKSAGLAYVGVRNSCHFGAAGYYANLAAKADMIGMAMSNDIPSMAVPGSQKAILGTNPFAYAVPAGKEDPIFLDIASAAVAGGKIRILQALNQKVPDGWLVDEEGVPTNDPFAYPFKGSLLPFAGHKGYGFAVMIESLAGLLAGGAIRWEMLSWIDHDPTKPTHHGAAFLAFDVGQITPIQTFKDRVDAMIRDIHESPKAKGSSRICLPGEIEWGNLRKSKAEGIVLPDDVREALRGLAQDVGMTVDWL
jgi:ureidoglycolate dehydrogenase (NAD+)